MSTDSNTKAMEEALQAAVARMNRSGTDSGAPTDPISLLMSLIPRLLEHNQERDDVLEKLEGLTNDGLAPLREQLLAMRKQLHLLRKSHREMLEQLRQVQEQEAATGKAVLHLARQMARVEIIEEMPDDDGLDLDDDEDLEPSVSAGPARRRPIGEHKTTSRKPKRP
ncbi:MAG: hypothetical protein JW940_35915 [Polyangiaceae bacterium]|nr:hypothetical protein [Polyangiaceae bacterium]